MTNPKMMFLNADGGAGGGDTTATATTTATANTTTTTATSTSGFVADDGSFVQGWTDKLPEDMGETRASFGRFKTVHDLAKSYKGLEQRLGKAATAVFVPGENATPEEVSAYRKAIGALDSVDDYAKIKPESLPEGVQWNDDLARPVLELAHKYNIPAEAVKEYQQLRVQQEAARAEILAQDLQRQLDQGTEQLQKEWGSNYKANIEKVAAATRMAGFDPSAVPGLRDPEAVKVIQFLAGKISDDVWRQGAETTNSSSMTAKDIQTNPSNPLYERYQKGDPDTVAQVRRLLAQGR